MQYDDKLIEDAVLALLAIYSFDEGTAWKGFDFEIMNRLHEHGFISNPVNKKKIRLVDGRGVGARARGSGPAVSDRGGNGAGTRLANLIQYL